MTQAESGQISIEEIKQWMQQCKADEPLDPAIDKRYVDLASLRGTDNLILSIRDRIKVLGNQTCQLFSGFTGTGKSSELRNLKQLLETENYIVILIAIENYHDLSRALEIEDLLITIAGAIGEETADKLGKKGINVPGYWDRFTKFLTETDVELSDIKLPKEAGDLKAILKHAKPLWLKIRDKLASEPRKLSKDVHAYIGERVADLKVNFPGNKGVVFLIDSLEKLKGLTPDAFHGVMKSVILIFSQYDDFLKLPDCHVVYSVPPYTGMLSSALNTAYDNRLQPLPVVKIFEYEGKAKKRYNAGIDTLVQVIDKRIPLARAFGSDLNPLKDLVAYSGGHLKTLLILIREVLLKSVRLGFPPTQNTFDDVIQSQRELMTEAIRPEGIHLLNTIRETGEISDVREEDLQRLAQYMDTQVVLCYRNGEGRYEIHPLVEDYVKEQAERLKSAQRDQPTDENA